MPSVRGPDQAREGQAAAGEGPGADADQVSAHNVPEDAVRRGEQDVGPLAAAHQQTRHRPPLAHRDRQTDRTHAHPPLPLPLHHPPSVLPRTRFSSAALFSSPFTPTSRHCPTRLAPHCADLDQHRAGCRGGGDDRELSRLPPRLVRWVAVHSRPGPSHTPLASLNCPYPSVPSCWV